MMDVFVPPVPGLSRQVVAETCPPAGHTEMCLPRHVTSPPRPALPARIPHLSHTGR